MDSLVLAYGNGEEEDPTQQLQEVKDEQACTKKRKSASLSCSGLCPSIVGEETAEIITCAFIGPADQRPPHSPARSPYASEKTASCAFIGPAERPPHSSPPPCSLSVDQEIATCVFIRPAEPPLGFPNPCPSFQHPTSLPPGRYVSKRERAALSSAILAPIKPQTEQVASGGLQSLIPSDAHQSTNSFARANFRSQLPKGLFAQLKAHSKAITAVRWSPTHSTFFPS
ncbi:hypothetical protein L7F22_036434 [Adiantum nelumboides]|nr:hypothetical protein [Adiantum nelumboides]